MNFKPGDLVLVLKQDLDNGLLYRESLTNKIGKVRSVASGRVWINEGHAWGWIPFKDLELIYEA